MLFAPNPKQKIAIEHERGPMLVVAGAGTGKTSVLVQRVARLVSANLAAPGEILCVTYMRNAARELKERIAAETGAAARDVQAYTIHGYCEGVLRRAGQDFRHIEKEDLWIYLRQNIQSLELRHFSKASNPGEFLHDLLELFDRCNDELKTSADYAAYVDNLRKSGASLPRVGKFPEGYEPAREEILGRCEEIARVFAKLESILAAKGMMTYGQMIPATINVLRNSPATLAQERERARFILVDEFQDCNRGQIELMALLTGDDRNIFAVGDPDQAIYRFRGATSAAFEEFLSLYPEARGVVLDENQRSRTPILRCAYTLINENPGIAVPTRAGDSFARALPISVRDNRQPAAPQPVVAAIGKGREAEANEVAACIEEMRKTPSTSSSKPRFGVLYRQHIHRNDVVAELARRGIPYAVSGLNVLDTPEVRDLAAILRAMVFPYDGTSLFRVSALPVFGIDGATIQGMLSKARGKTPLPELLATIPGGKKVIAALDEARRVAVNSGASASQAAEIAVRRFDLDRHHDAVDAFVSNKQLIEADGGTVILSARAKDALLSTVINNQGIVEARSVSSKDGVILLDGGTGGVVASSGTLNAAGVSAGELGGHIEIIGDKVGLFDNAVVNASGNAALFDSTLAALDIALDGDFVFANHVDFDMLYGHRRDVTGYASALEAFDRRLPELEAKLQDGDLVVLTSDHGCDPTWRGSDHTRELVPILAFGPGMPSKAIGVRETFADIGESLAAHLGLAPGRYGKSFL